MTPLGASALRLAVLGWPVFPLYEPISVGVCSCERVGCSRPGKHPRTRRGLKDASIDPDQIRAWWARWPHANIAVRTGTGLTVIDVDGEKGAHTAQALDLPRTTESRTGRGRHLFYATREAVRSSSGRVGPGIDIRSEGGYVIVPPSIHPNGRRYRWRRDPEVVPLTPFPTSLWFSAGLPSTPHPRSSRSLEWSPTKNHKKGGGDWSRSGVDARIVLDLVRRGRTEQEILQVVAGGSAKYQEMAPPRAAAYFHATLTWARRAADEAGAIVRARVEDAGVEYSQALGKPDLARVLFALRIVTGPRSGEPIRARVLVPSPGYDDERAFRAVFGSLDPAQVFGPKGDSIVRPWIGRHLELGLDGRTVRWVRISTKSP